MKKTGDYYVVVVEDTNLGQIVATATLITEHKFIHSCAKVSYIPTSNLCIFNNGYSCKTDPIQKLLINVVVIRSVVMINIAHHHKQKKVTFTFLCPEKLDVKFA